MAGSGVDPDHSALRRGGADRAGTESEMQVWWPWQCLVTSQRPHKTAQLLLSRAATVASGPRKRHSGAGQECCL